VVGKGALNQKPRENNSQGTQDNCGREHLITGIPPVVATLPRVDVPLAVVGVPVRVHDTGVSRIQDLPYHHPLNALWIVFYSGPRSPLISDTN